MSELRDANDVRQTSLTDIKKRERNVYSQYGEDGIIEWVFSRLAPGSKTCVEFGAWDGRNLSNTFNLVAHHGWRAIYIEADPQKFPALQRTAAAYPAITPVRSLVGSVGETALDAILHRHDVPQEFDLLSIDIDGNDYDVWEASTRYRPRLVIVEFNPTFPAEFNYVDRDGRGFIGSSAAAFAALAARKGYGLLARTETNLFFLRDDCFAALGAVPQMVSDVLGREAACYAFLNYAGEIVLSNEAMTRRLSSVNYAEMRKTWARRLSGAPTFYLLGEQHAAEGAVLKFLRAVASFGRRRRAAKSAGGAR